MKYKWLIASGALALCLPTPAARSADLSEVYQRALVSDPTLASINYERLATQGDKGKECGKLLPQISVPGSYTDFNANRSGVMLGDSSATTTGQLTGQQWMAGIRLDQTLFDVPKFMNCQKARVDMHHGDATYDIGIEDLIYRTVQAYVNDLAAQSHITSSTSMVELRISLLDEAKKGFDAQTVSQLQLNDAIDQLKSAQAKKSAAQTALVVAQATLEGLAGQQIPVNMLAPLRKNMPVMLPQPPRPEYWANIAEKGNLQLVAEALQVDSSKYAMKSAYGEMLPEVGFFARHTFYDSNITRPNSLELDGDKGTSDTQVFGFEGKWQLFSGGSNYSAAQAAKNRYKSESMKYEAQRRSIRTAAQKAVSDLLSFEAAIESASTALSSALTNLDAVKLGVQATTKTQTDLLNAQTQVLDAQTTLDDSQFAYVTGMVEYWKALGVLTDGSIDDINNWLVHPVAARAKSPSSRSSKSSPSKTTPKSQSQKKADLLLPMKLKMREIRTSETVPIGDLLPDDLMTPEVQEK